MSAFLIAQVDIRDAKIYGQYAERSLAIITKYGGRILARGGTSEVLEGSSLGRRVVVIEFRSLDVAREFYRSPEYQQAKELRAPIADAQFVIVEGIAAAS